MARKGVTATDVAVRDIQGEILKEGLERMHRLLLEGTSLIALFEQNQKAANPFDNLAGGGRRFPVYDPRSGDVFTDEWKFTPDP